MNEITEEKIKQVVRRIERRWEEDEKAEKDAISKFPDPAGFKDGDVHSVAIPNRNPIAFSDPEDFEPVNRVTGIKGTVSKEGRTISVWFLA